VTETSTEIELIIFSENITDIGVMVSSKNSFYAGFLGNYEQYLNEFTFTTFQENLQIGQGDVVYTNGLDYKFKTGIKIGTVSQIIVDDTMNNIELKVTPGANFNDLSFVTVVK